jgi:hypothetical protein
VFSRGAEGKTVIHSADLVAMAKDLVDLGPERRRSKVCFKWATNGQAGPTWRIRTNCGIEMLVRMRYVRNSPLAIDESFI